MQVKSLRANQITIPENADLQYVDRLKGHDFEHFVGELLTTRGFDQVKITQASGDYGVDVLARKDGKHYAIQAKRYSSNVDRKAVSDSVAGRGFYKCQVAMVVTNSYFTKSAKIYANELGCELVDRDVLKRWLEEYHLAVVPGITNGVRLQISRHRILLATLAGLTIFVLILFALAEPLCAVFC
jgi:HJR/Mrr/RecB family endonuclease